MIKFELDPVGDRLLVEMWAEKKSTKLILLDKDKKGSGRQSFFKVVGIGSGDFVQDNYQVDDLLMLNPGTQLPTFELGKDMRTTALIEAHMVWSKVRIIEGEIFAVGHEEVLTPEQADALAHPLHEPN
ncbi:MAG: hypothetical protein H8D23_17780 [Candidatus Brocadiales bacterium]|nr:hypothetical protein [Candidatus Brocadiales bacterium]